MYSTVVSLASTPKGGRIYLEGKWLLKAGFTPMSAFEVEIEQGCVTLRHTNAGTRRVSAKSAQTIPVIDIQNQALQQAFRTCTKLQVEADNQTITITPAYTAARVEARKQAAMTEGSLFSGGGLLTEAAAGLGFRPRFAVEVVPAYAEIFATNHPSADMYNCSVEEVQWEKLRSYAPLGLLTMGVPCEAFSAARSIDRGTQGKRDRSVPPEAHENGDLTFFALRAIEATNPRTILIEESPNYLKAASGYVMQSVLRRWGYHVDARIISPVDYGELQLRKRAVIVARTDGPVVWPQPLPIGSRHISDILDPDEEVAGEWFDRTTKKWLFDHWDRQTAKGNGFAGQVVTAESTQVGTIKKRYLALQGDNPVLKHPTREGTYRMFTLKEIMRLAALRPDYYLGGSKTTAGEVLGQGIVVSTLSEVISLNTGLGSTLAAPPVPAPQNSAAPLMIDSEPDFQCAAADATLASSEAAAREQLSLFTFTPPDADSNTAPFETHPC